MQGLRSNHARHAAAECGPRNRLRNPKSGEFNDAPLLSLERLFTFRRLARACFFRWCPASVSYAHNILVGL